MAHANQAIVTGSAAQIAVLAAAGDGGSDWQAVRRSADIQYAPLPPITPPEPPPTPEWVQLLGRALEAVFAPIGRFLGLSWPIFQWILLAAAVTLVLFILWRLAGPLVRRWLEPQPEPESPHWVPGREEAVALLADADRLAAAGQFGEATHLLLRRSVRQIRDARPDWLIPATTAREIAVLPMLPHPGRSAFAAIATRVERSLFALRDLDAADWAAARAAYSEFARMDLPAEPAR